MNICMSNISLLPIYLKMESGVRDTERSRTIYLTLNNIIPMIKQRMISWTCHVQRWETVFNETTVGRRRQGRPRMWLLDNQEFEGDC